METTSIKCYEDGNNLVLIFENCSLSMKEMIMNLLHPAACPALDAEPVAAPLLDPYIDYRAYHGPCSEILRQDGDRAFANLLHLSSNRMLDNSEEEYFAIMEHLDMYLKNRFSGIDDPERYVAELPDQEVQNFFRYFQEDFSFSTKKILCEDTGCLDYRTFLDQVSLEVKRTAMVQILKKDYCKTPAA